MTAFEYDSLADLFEAGSKVCDIFEPFKDEKVGPGLQTIIDAGRFPFYTEGMAYYQVVHDFVTEWLARSAEGASDVYALAFYEALVSISWWSSRTASLGCGNHCTRAVLYANLSFLQRYRWILQRAWRTKYPPTHLTISLTLLPNSYG
jgi:hypothetical protein